MHPRTKSSLPAAFTNRTLCRSVIATAVAANLAACAGNDAGGTSSSQRVLTPSEFVAPAVSDVAAEPAEPKVTDGPATDPARVAAPPARERPPTAPPTADLTARIGAPDAANPAAPPTTDPFILEALVGQVNGRPVFASEILEPLDGRLRALVAKTPDRARWLREAAPIVNEQLERIIQNELVLAEARAALTPEQKQGLFFFVNDLQQRIVAQQGGSAVAADEASRAALGRTLTQRTRDALDEVLIGEELNQRILSRVFITRRQVELEYERRQDVYNPPPRAIFRAIAVPSGKADDVARIKSRLDSGEPFTAVADDPANIFGAGEKNIFATDVKGSFEEGKFFANSAINQTAQGLSPGMTGGPLDADGATWWIHLERVDRRPGTSLYDAQLEIERELRSRRLETEQRRYISRLKARGNFSRIEDMLGRLLVIAQDRYFPSQQ